MSFLIFEYDPARDEENFVSALAFLLLKPRDTFKIVKDNEFSISAERNPTLAKMVSYFAIKKNRRSKFIVQSKLELKTDKYLIDSYGDAYVGYVSNNENKASVLARLKLREKLQEYEALKMRFNISKHFFDLNSKNIEISESQIDEFIALTHESAKPVIQWLDEHARADKEAYAALSPLIMRNF